MVPEGIPAVVLRPADDAGTQGVYPDKFFAEGERSGFNWGLSLIHIQV